MNILTDGLPTEIKVGGLFYSIDGDYRNCLDIMLAFEDERLNLREKQWLMLKLLYDEVPLDILEAAEKAMWFLNLGDEAAGTISAKPVYSFAKDARLIRSAFRVKNIELDVDFLHWWDFIGAFFDLKDTMFNEIMGVRARLNSGKASKQDKEFARENPGIVRLNEGARTTSTSDDFMRRYEEGKRNREKKQAMAML